MTGTALSVAMVGTLSKADLDVEDVLDCEATELSWMGTSYWAGSDLNSGGPLTPDRGERPVA
jgi:hypothetical protein